MADFTIAGLTLRSTQDGTEELIVDLGGGVYRRIPLSSIPDYRSILSYTQLVTPVGSEGIKIEESGGTVKYITVDDILASLRRIRTVTFPVIDPATALTTGDGKYYWVVPEELDGANIILAHAHVFTASSSGLPSIMLHNETLAQDVLSTAITLDVSETDSKDAVTQPVINTTYDHVATGDVLRWDIDAIGTGTAGLQTRLQFQA